MPKHRNAWRVEKAGSSTSGYGRGWFATNILTGVGAWFSTWIEAMEFANRQDRRDAERFMNAEVDVDGLIRMALRQKVGA